MPRGVKATPTMKRQVYDIGDGATVTIDFDENRRPRLFHDDRVAIIGNHVCSGVSATAPVLPSEPSLTSGPTEDTPEMIAWKERRKKPLSTEDIAREAGLSPDALSFENLSAAAQAMGGGDIVE